MIQMKPAANQPHPPARPARRDNLLTFAAAHEPAFDFYPSNGPVALGGQCGNTPRGIAANQTGNGGVAAFEICEVAADCKSKRRAASSSSTPGGVRQGLGLGWALQWGWSTDGWAEFLDKNEGVPIWPSAAPGKRPRLGEGERRVMDGPSEAGIRVRRAG